MPDCDCEKELIWDIVEEGETEPVCDCVVDCVVVIELVANWEGVLEGVSVDVLVIEGLWELLGLCVNVWDAVQD